MDNNEILENTPALPTTERTTATETASAWVCPDFKVSGIFSSHMVLQREKPIRVWGFSDTPGSRVAGSFMGETVTATVGEDNRWTLTFSSHLVECEPQIMVISDDRDHTVTFEDILIGDVWLIGGQSNAEMNLLPCMTYTPSMEFYEGDNFRLFSQTQGFTYTHQEFCASPQPDIINPEWCWRRPDREASLWFSALGWYFAHEVTKYIGVPLGMLMIAAGGACIRELIPVELAHSAGYTYGANVQEGGYFNALINPVLGLGCKAMLFFQGESEGCVREQAEKYAYDFALLIADERIRFGQEFPVYYVQLSDYRDECFQYFPWLDIVRTQQLDALAIIPNSTMTVDMDLGAPEDWPDFAHSPRKLELAERLAKLALAKEYGIGRETECSSPRPIMATLSPDGKKIVVEFTDISAGLIVSGHNPADSYGMEVQGFSVGDYDHRAPAHAVISSRHAVTVDIPEEVLAAAEANPEEAKSLVGQVNYAFFIRVTPENADLRGGNNLPAPAFSMKVTAV